MFSAELLTERVGHLGGDNPGGRLVLLFWLPLVLVCIKAPINLLLHLATFMKPTDSVFATANGILNSVFPTRQVELAYNLLISTMETKNMRFKLKKPSTLQLLPIFVLQVRA